MSIFYKSIRIGKGGKPFFLYKFRSMREESGPSSTSADDPRITRIGRFMRRFKLDEIPQFWNILRGNMVFFGPRPDIPEVIDLMSDEERAIILSTKPGLFDLASLSNIHEEERLKGSKDPHATYLKEIWPEKKRLQIECIKNRSWKLNLTILTKTIWRIMKK